MHSCDVAQSVHKYFKVSGPSILQQAHPLDPVITLELCRTLTVKSNKWLKPGEDKMFATKKTMVQVG